MTAVAGSTRFDHPALLYSSVSSYVTAVTTFVRAGLDAGDPVLVAVPAGNLALVRHALGAEAARVRFADMAQAGRNPGRIIPTVLLEFAAGHPDRRVRIVGEPIWAERGEDEYPACVVHEALINVAFQTRNAAILCPYDASRLAPAALDDAARTHPTLTDGTRTWTSSSYTDPFATVATHNRPLPPPPPDAASIAYLDESDLAVVRRFIRAHAARAGLVGDRTDALVLAVNELTGNTIVHTHGGGRVRLWHQDDQIVCQVEDAGHLADPMTGRLPRAGNLEGGRGLLMVNLLVDLVRVYTTPAGSTIRVYYDLR